MCQRRLGFAQARLDFTRFADVTLHGVERLQSAAGDASTMKSFREILSDATSFFAAPTALGFPGGSFNGAFTDTAAF